MIQIKDPGLKIQEILQFFGSAHRDTLLTYCARNLEMEDRAENFLDKFLHRKNIACDESGMCRLYEALPISIAGACSFAIFSALAESEASYFDTARHPFHYIFGIDGKIYLLLDMAQQGIYRLNYLQNMNQPDLPAEERPIPILMLINDATASLPVQLLPSYCMIALVTYRNGKIQNVSFKVYDTEGRGRNERD